MIGFFAGLIGVTFYFRQMGSLSWMLLTVGGVAAVSYLDDRAGVPPLYRLLAHLAGAVILVLAGFTLDVFGIPGSGWVLSPWLGATVSVLFIVWMINLYNFMDGMDGFAGGMAVIGFGSFAVLGWLAGNDLFFATNLVITAAVSGFLVRNFPPARIFMGDAGSSSLGLLAAALSLWGARDDVFPFWVALLVFAPFVVDATATLLQRLTRREKVWEAHKTHYYQRLVQLGWGHRKTVLWEYVLMLSCAGSAVWANASSASIQFLILGFCVCAYLLLLGLIPMLERKSRAERCD